MVSEDEVWTSQISSAASLHLNHNQTIPFILSFLISFLSCQLITARSISFRGLISEMEMGALGSAQKWLSVKFSNRSKKKKKKFFFFFTRILGNQD